MLFGIKIDVDTERGTRIGVPNLVAALRELGIVATFLFSLGPDNTGRAITRIFRPGFLKKVSRTKVVSTYGLRTLLNGVLLPGPNIGKRHASIMRATKSAGFEVGIHAYDHQRWQDGVTKMTDMQTASEFAKACQVFGKIFNEPAQAAGAPGWQTTAAGLTAYDSAQLTYGSDCRGQYPFFPQIGGRSFQTLQVPTTLPTLDELLGRPGFSENELTGYYLGLLNDRLPNIMTIHAELEGMKYLDWFREFASKLKERDIEFKTLGGIARKFLEHKNQIATCKMEMAEIEGRSGLVAKQQSNTCN